MEQHGFIHDMLDVKVLVLFVMSRVKYPCSLQTIYELCYQDDTLSYFDIRVAVPEMVESGHLLPAAGETYQISEKGLEQEKVTSDAIAYPVMQRAIQAVESYNRSMRRKEFIHTRLIPGQQEDYTVEMTLRDEISTLMRMELTAPNITQARALARAFETRADGIFQMVMTELLNQAERNRKENL